MKFANVTLLALVALHAASGETLRTRNLMIGEEGDDCKGNGVHGCVDGLSCVDGTCVSDELSADDDCIAQFNQGICMKMARMTEDIKQGKGIDKDNLNQMTKLMMENRPADPKKKKLNEAADRALKNDPPGAERREMVFEIISQLNDPELEERLVSDLARNYSVVEDNEIEAERCLGWNRG